MKSSTSSTSREPLKIEQLNHAELILMVLELQKIIAILTEKIAISQGKGQSKSQTSSKPSSTDLIEKSGGHQEKTRMGFRRIDRVEICQPSLCLDCGSSELSKAIDHQKEQVAGLLLKSLRDKEDQWWYFLNDLSVPPDNNLAELSLRLAVTKGKVSGDSCSMKRFEQTADLLSVIQSCRFQARYIIDIIAFFCEAISAHSCDLATPSLIPLN